MLSNEQLNETLIRLESRFERMEALLQEMMHVLDGNGRPGVKENVTRLDMRVQALEEERRTGHVPRAIWIPLLFSILLGISGIVVPLVK